MAYGQNWNIQPDFNGYGNSFRNNPNGRNFNSGFLNFKRSNYKNGNYNMNIMSSPKRRSHCKLSPKGDIVYVTGWKVGKRAGFRTFLVSPSKSGFKTTSKSGKVWHGCRVKVVNKTHGSSGIFPGLIEEATKKVFIRDLGIMMNPNTGFISYIPKK